MLCLDNLGELDIEGMLDGLLVDSGEQVAKVLELRVGKNLLTQLTADIHHTFLVESDFLLIFFHALFLAYLDDRATHVLESLVHLLLGSDEAVGLVDAVT